MNDVNMPRTIMNNVAQRFFLAASVVVMQIFSVQVSEAQDSALVEGQTRGEAVTVLVRYHLLPDRVDIAMQDILQLTSTVVAEEADCLGIEVLQDVYDPTIVTLVERWTSREVYEGAHMQTAHLRSFIERARDNFSGPPDISFWVAGNAP